MSNLDAEIQEISDRIARLVRDAYKRGANDAIDRMVRAARSDRDDVEQASATVERDDVEERGSRKRAPKGSVDALVTRALGNGASKTPDEIKAQAATDHERMIALPSIRSHLRKGETEGRYRKEGGRWYAINTGSIEKPQTGDPVGDRAASGLWPNQEEHH